MAENKNNSEQHATASNLTTTRKIEQREGRGKDKPVTFSCSVSGFPKTGKTLAEMMLKCDEMAVFVHGLFCTQHDVFVRGKKDENGKDLDGQTVEFSKLPKLGRKMSKTAVIKLRQNELVAGSVAMATNQNWPEGWTAENALAKISELQAEIAELENS